MTPLILLSILIVSLGFDRIGLRVNDITLRFSYLLCLAAFCCLGIRRQIRVPILPTICLLAFLVLAIPSIFVSFNLPKSLAYIAWVLANYLLIFVVFSAFARTQEGLLYRALVYAFRFQILIAAVMMVLGLNGSVFEDRAHFFYYEPSFFAVALASYCGIVAVRVFSLGVKANVVDIALLILALLTTKAAFLMVVIPLTFLLRLLFVRITLKRVIAVVLAFIIGFVAVYQYAVTSTGLIASTLQGVFLSEDPIQYLLLRSGGRSNRLVCAWGVFAEHPYTGVGLGAYEAYTRSVDLRYCNELGAAYRLTEDDITDAPPISIYVELLATTGLFATMAFLAFLLSILCSGNPKKLNEIQVSYFIGLLAILVVMSLQATYLTLCIWMALGIYHGSLKARSAYSSATSVIQEIPTRRSVLSAS